MVRIISQMDLYRPALDLVLVWVAAWGEAPPTAVVCLGTLLHVPQLQSPPCSKAPHIVCIPRLARACWRGRGLGADFLITIQSTVSGGKTTVFLITAE